MIFVALLLIFSVAISSGASSSNRLSGEQILSKNGNGSFSVNYKSISSVLMHPEVRNRKIVAISIVGALRKGKSFFMNYCLRFMYANVRRQADPPVVVINFSFPPVQVVESS
jgi:Guanylate-binding protein, N-terminal domain